MLLGTWSFLIRHRQELRDDVERAFAGTPAVSAYGPYELARATFDRYAGRLGYGIPCDADRSCASSICYAGTVCGDPLGAGSTCTRGMECASFTCTSGLCEP
jgi:hypothetical protein